MHDQGLIKTMQNLQSPLFSDNTTIIVTIHFTILQVNQYHMV
jgi:hypothetical protein